MKSAIQSASRADREGCHLVSYYYREDHLLLKSALFIKDGLEAGEKCYIDLDSSQLPLLNKILTSFGVDPERAKANGQLVISNTEQLINIYKSLGSDAVRVYMEDTLQQDLDEGYSGVRCLGDTETGILTFAPEIHLEWEKAIDNILADVPITILCMYNIENLPDKNNKRLTRLVNDTLKCHSYILKGNKMIKTKDMEL